MAEVDLEHLSQTYRFRPFRSEGESRVRMAIARVAVGASILDVGGGNGAHSEVMQAEGYRPVVMDPSAAQRSKAGSRGVAVVGGVAQMLPFPNDTFGMAYYHLSLHYGDWTTALAEACRVVEPGGLIWVWTFSRTYLETSYLGRWFPSVRSHDLVRFPESGAVAHYLDNVGLKGIEVARRTERVQRTVGEWQEAFAARFVSTLQMIDAAELARGIENFRHAHQDPDEIITSELEFEAISGSV